MSTLWTVDEHMLAEEMYGDGWPERQIAKRLGRSLNGVRSHLYRFAPDKRRPWTATDINRLMGAPMRGKWARRMLEAGYLRGRKLRQAGRQHVYAITEDDLFAFIEDPEHWHRWEPAAITAPAIREWAQEVRSEAYLTAPQVAKRYGVSTHTVHGWVASGALPASRSTRLHIRERDLEGFVPPFARSLVGQSHREFTAEEDRRLFLCRSLGWTWTRVAEVVGRDASTCRKRYQLLLSRIEEQAA